MFTQSILFSCASPPPPPEVYTSVAFPWFEADDVARFEFFNASGQSPPDIGLPELISSPFYAFLFSFRDAVHSETNFSGLFRVSVGFFLVAQEATLSLDNYNRSFFFFVRPM